MQFRFRFMVFNATFNNISVISWHSVLFVGETGVPGENHWPAVSHWQTLSHNVVSNIPRLSGIQTHNVSGDRHWLHSSFKSKHNATTMAPMTHRRYTMYISFCSSYITRWHFSYLCWQLIFQYDGNLNKETWFPKSIMPWFLWLCNKTFVLLHIG